MPENLNTTIILEDGMYVAKSIEFGIVSQGKTEEKAEKNLQEALNLFFEE